MPSSPVSLRPILALVVVAFAAVAGPARSEETLPQGQSGIVRTLLPTVVNISVKKQEAPAPADSNAPVETAAPTDPDSAAEIKNFVGSGFIIDPSGIVVTNYHVVEDAFDITVTLSDGTRLPGKTMAASRLADIAILKIDAGHPLPAARWGNSDALQVGDQVLAAGDPFGIGLSISAGIVSGLNRDIQNSPYDDLIQTDATINHGNSGGPLFDMQGYVVGVDSALISPTAGSVGLGFAIPSSSAQFVVDQLRTYGWVHPAWIGIKLQQVTPEIAEATGMTRPYGSIVCWVLANGPAAKAGLQIGDVILRFNGKAPTDERALLRDIAHTPADSKVSLLVRRDQQEQTVDLVTESWPRDQWDARDAPTPPPKPKIVIPPNLGLTLAPVPPAERTKLGLPNGMNGVLVKEVVPTSDSALRGLSGGDVILRVQDKPVATPQEVQAGIDAARSGKREYVVMLVLPKLRDVPGPKWVALRVASIGG